MQRHISWVISTSNWKIQDGHQNFTEHPYFYFLFFEKDQLKCEILNKNEEEEKLSQKIVQSPAKVRAEQEGLKQQVDDLMETLQRKRHRLG